MNNSKVTLLCYVYARVSPGVGTVSRGGITQPQKTKSTIILPVVL